MAKKENYTLSREKRCDSHKHATWLDAGITEIIQPSL